MQLALTILIIFASCQAAVHSATHSPENVGPEQADLNEFATQLHALKSVVESSQKEQWEALQSLRFYLLSTRTAIKELLSQVKELKEQSSVCKADKEDTSAEEDKENEKIPAGPSAAGGCVWPGEVVAGRCLAFITDSLMTWTDAQKHCRSLGGTLAGEADLATLSRHLTSIYGINASRVRWSVWAGARQTLDGWRWANSSCSEGAVGDSVWSAGQPPAPAVPGAEALCMALDGFDEYKGTAVPCSALRRFVCDLA
ncbi:uncharacterized protein LOC108675671 [Hyalella azteca]|uniref:Uncharacterized protein LOC108675671 n=1 Tax=Hyalella azteca TaxID=294128 RepID=A0A8B7NZI7_HYAAZ|nr:uncharacterized protein LOC108675671 [Hyalella azteca]